MKRIRRTRPARGVSMSQRGSVLIILAAVLFIAMISFGFALEVSRVYSAKRTALAAADAAALAAVMELDGSAAGLERADRAARKELARMGAGVSARIEWAQDTAGPWMEQPGSAFGLRCARLTVTLFVPLTMMRPVVAKESSHAWAMAAAEQRPKTQFDEGLSPYSVFAQGTEPPHYGLVPGKQYALRWAKDPSVDKGNVCNGEANVESIVRATGHGITEAGFYEMVNRNAVRRSIQQGYQTTLRSIGDPLVLNLGLRHFELSDLVERIGQDADYGSTTYEEYAGRNTGNGRRLMAAVIHNGFPKYQIVQVGAFFLLPVAEYHSEGDYPFCAEYIGAFLQNGRRRAAAEGGFHVTTLVR